MKHTEVINLMKEIGLPFAYDHFAEGEAPAPPFLCFLYPNAVNFSADNIVYFSQRELHIEIYTKTKEPSLEEKVEQILTKHEMYFQKSEVYISSQNIYEVLYTIVV